jgi:galactokinase
MNAAPARADSAPISATELRAAFQQHFGGEPQLFRAPGRVNLIGEHTDYNDGWVMPMAIDRYISVAIATTLRPILRVHSLNYAETVEISLPVADRSHAARAEHWSDYVRAVVWALQQRGITPTAADVVLHGAVPVGSGLSSSAALEVAIALALLEVGGTALSASALAQLCCHAENDYVGMRCGIMDQYAASSGKQGYALMLDCRLLQHELLPLPTQARVVICNTMVKHSHAGGEYNNRRAECEAGLSWLAARVAGKRALRDVSMAELDEHGAGLEPLLLRRCRHVISENQRVNAAAAALRNHDLAAFGKLMQQSHQSLRDDYAVSCHELDVMVKLAMQMDGVYGARMTGGGFGGCTVNLVHTDAVDNFCSSMATAYQQRTGLHPQIHVSDAAAGAQRWQV